MGESKPEDRPQSSITFGNSGTSFRYLRSYHRMFFPAVFITAALFFSELPGSMSKIYDTTFERGEFTFSQRTDTLGAVSAAALNAVTAAGERTAAYGATAMNGGSAAEERTDTLGASVATASRGAAAFRSSAARSVNGRAIERSGAAGLHEVLRGWPGVNIRDYGGIGGMKTVSLRGFGAQHTAVICDGVPVSDAQNGSIDISGINVHSLAEVSLETGASEEIFRSARLGAAAGTLSLKTREPVFGDKSIQAEAAVSYASFRTWSPSLDIRQRLGQKWSACASAVWMSSEGDYPFTLKNGKESIRARRLGSAVRALNGGMSVYGPGLQAKLNWRHTERGLPGQVIFYTQNPTEKLWDSSLSSSVCWTREWSRKWRTRISAAYSQSANRYLDNSPKYPEPEDDRYLQREYAVYGIIGLKTDNHLEFALAEDVFANVLDSDIPECVFPRRITSVSGLSGKYGRGRLRVVGSLTLTYAHEWVRKGAAADGFLRLSPTLSAAYALSEKFHIRGSCRDGFRVPSFNDLYYARVGTVSLRPEKSRQVNLGLSWYSGFRRDDRPGAFHGRENSRKERKTEDRRISNGCTRGSVSLTADFYYGGVRDKIAAVPTMFIWKMRNIGKVEAAGAELSALCHASLSELMRAHLTLCYSFQHAVDRSDAEAKNYGHQIPYTPRHSGSAAAALETPWFTLSYTVCAVSERYFLAQNLRANALEPYLDHTAALAKNIDIGRIMLRLSVDALNLSGKNYEIVQGYPMPGRSYRLNLRFSYK